MIWFALACSVAAFFSGIAAVGSGRDWHFTNRDILAGKRNAILYIWVTLSTMFSMAHSLMIATWVFIVEGQHIVGPVYTARWMTLHAAMGLLFVGIHLFIKSFLKQARNEPASYLWGAR